MITRIEKVFTFDAAHHLPHVGDGHKCSRLHGHTYRVVVRLQASVLGSGVENGMVMDYDRLSAFVRPIVDGELDHRCLNHIAGLENPTTEVLARWLWDRLRPLIGPLLVAVVVHESATTSCEVACS